MARRKRVSVARVAIWVAVIVAIVAGLWFARDRLARPVEHLISTSNSHLPVTPNDERIDPSSDGHVIRVSGKLEIAKQPRDPQLGVGADAALLFRKVEMMQWQEHCAGADCTYDTAWSAAPIDSHKFKHASGHENPPQRFANARFDAGDIRLGAYTIDAEVVATQLKAVDYPTHAADLPPNMAASFSESNGVLYAGGDANQPKVGTVRVSYAIVTLTSVTLSGVQKGTRLLAH
jgi:transmembrane protein TMEM43